MGPRAVRVTGSRGGTGTGAGDPGSELGKGIVWIIDEERIGSPFAVIRMLRVALWRQCGGSGTASLAAARARVGVVLVQLFLCLCSWRRLRLGLLFFGLGVLMDVGQVLRLVVCDIISEQEYEEEESFREMEKSPV